MKRILTRILLISTVVLLGHTLFLSGWTRPSLSPSLRVAAKSQASAHYSLPVFALGVSALIAAMIATAARKRIFQRQSLRSHFPFFKTSGLAYLDSAATTQKPKQVVEAISDFYLRHCANVHRSGHSLGNAATQAYEESRKKIAKFLGVSEKNLVITRGATASLNDIARALEKCFQPGGKVVVSEAAHSSNFLPWTEIAKSAGAELVVLPATATEAEILRLLDVRVKVVAVSHVSHVFGSEFPIHAISEHLKLNAPDALLIVDGCQAAGHLNPWSPEAVDAYVISGHKMCGPTGVGATYLSDRLIRKLEKFNLGGGTVDTFNKQGEYTLATFPFAFEAGTPPIAEAVGLGVAADFLYERRKAILSREGDLLRTLEKEVLKIPGVRPLTDKFPRVVPLVSFTFPDVNAVDVAALASNSVCIRAGVHCAAPLHAAVGAYKGSLRLSLAFYNEEKEVISGVKAVSKALRVLRGEK